MTLREAKDILRPYGIRIQKTGYGDEYRVSYAAHDLEESAYYADDIWDAIETGKVMAGHRTSNPGADELPYDEWIPAHAVRFNEDGTVSLMREDAAERIPNMSDGFMDKAGHFHPIRWSDDYDRSELTKEDAEKKDYFGTPSAAYYKKHHLKAPKGTPRGGSSLLTKKKKRR